MRAPTASTERRLPSPAALALAAGLLAALLPPLAGVAGRLGEPACGAAPAPLPSHEVAQPARPLEACLAGEAAGGSARSVVPDGQREPPGRANWTPA